MQALIGALYWLNSGIEDKSISDDKKVIVKGLVDQRFTARENKAIAMLLCHLWKVVKNKVNINIRWVRGHSGDAGNTIADEFADLGTRLDKNHRWWKRKQPIGDWEESSFQLKLKKLEEEVQNTKALWVQWDGEVYFPRGDPPALKTITEAVSQSAKKWSAVSCKCSNEDDNRRRSETRRLNDEWKREKDPAKRKFLSIALFREWE